MQSTNYLQETPRYDSHSSAWTDTLIRLLALASRLEGEGQYNLAKLARAAADSMCREAACRVTIPADKEMLAADIKQTAETLAWLGVAAEASSALARTGAW